MLKSSDRPVNPHKQGLLESLVSEGLSCLGPTATGEYALLNLDLSNRGVHSLIGVEKYPHVQHINVSGNSLVKLKPLSGVRNLLTLNASGNQLVSLFDFRGETLIYADFSDNGISSMAGGDSHSALQILRLDSNRISQVTHIEKLPNLLLLSLNENNIETLERFPVSLQELYMAKNLVKRVDMGLSQLFSLRILDLSYNQLTSLRGLEFLESLMVLSLNGNLIKNINSLDRVAQIALLSDLELLNNPVQEKQYYRLRVVFKLPQLRSLDGAPFSAEEKIKAENLFGLDLEDKKAIFNRVFPGRPYVDRRLFTSEMLDFESESEEEDELVEQYKVWGHGTQSKLSKVSSATSLDPETLEISKRYVGELIEKVDSFMGL